MGEQSVRTSEATLGIVRMFGPMNPIARLIALPLLALACGTSPDQQDEPEDRTGGRGPMPVFERTCGTCNAEEVCCPDDLRCAGYCVPDCRSTARCPTDLVCDAEVGVCAPDDWSPPLGGSSGQ